MKYLIKRIIPGLLLLFAAVTAGAQTAVAYYPDNDHDNFGNDAQVVYSSTPLPDMVTVGGDCDDNNPDVHPGAPEICDGIDNNCNGILIEGDCPGQNGEVSPNCYSTSSVNVLKGEMFFNYGSVSNALNTKSRVNLTIGQPIVGISFGPRKNTALGFWSRFLLAPSAPSVRGTEGDLPDRIQINWSPDPLSPKSNSYNIYRNGALLASVEGVTSFIDFNVLAGQFYTYEVAGVNQFGEGYKGAALGFLNPNGVVTGQVKTFSGNPVPGAVVTLTPNIGTSLSFNGVATAFAEYDTRFPVNTFTVSAWVKLSDQDDDSGILDFGSNIGKNWWLHSLPQADGPGVRFGIGKSPSEKTQISYAFPASGAHEWHNVAATYNGAALLLYVDGELVGTAVGEIEADSSLLFVGKKSGASTGYMKGGVDDIRLFNRQLAQTEIQMLMNKSIGASAEGLVSYWKLDEGVGTKGFDLSVKRSRLYLCGAEWVSDRPVVVNAGVTDETGFYEIQGVNYGSGSTFKAVPSKNFYFNQALEFNAVNENYADLTEFSLTDSATITATVKAFDFSGKQVILSKSDSGGNAIFLLCLNAGNLELTIGNTTEVLGAIGMGYHHIALVLRKDGSSLYATCYRDGELLAEKSYSSASWSGLPWKLGARSAGPGTHDDYFTGLVDEVAFFNNLLSLPQIQTYASIGTSVTDPYLSSYFNLNEGIDELLHDMGTALTGSGTSYGAQWSTVAAITDVLPHEFTPASRLVTLNPSNTSTDQVDFTDQSTIPVTGYVRFENTNCFQKGVEILVNGKSNVPQIFTDADGKFIADFEPGASVVLTPKFEQHSFYPVFWELPSLSAPVSGILFRNQTKRKVTGQVAGGYCRKSVVPSGAIVKVKVATLNGCYEQIQQLPANGKFVFNGVPPDSVTVAVIEHSNPVIYNYFQNKGGVTLDLKIQNDTTDFIYFSPPQVEVSPLDTNACGDPMLEMLQRTQVTIKVFEMYDGGQCYVDTALLTINNDIAHLSQFDTLMTTGKLIHKFRVEEPNISFPYLKTLQVTAEVHDELATEALSAVVLGRRPRQTTFTSTAPDMPMLILRDPPGDASYAYLASGETTCQSWSVSASSTLDLEKTLTVSLGPDIETEMGTPFFATSLQVDVTADIGVSFNASLTSYSSNEMETCLTVERTVSTGENDMVVGSDMGGDVYMGGAMNFLYGITDELRYDTANCSFFLDKGLFVFPQGFATTFIYSEYQILNTVIPALELLGDYSSADRWRDIVNRNTNLKEEAVFSKNLSFDGGVTYEESETTENTKAVTTEWVQSFGGGFSTEFGVSVNGLGLSSGLSMNFTSESSKSSTNSASKTRTVGYVLADDDIGDNFTVNVKKDKAYGTPVFDLVSGQSQCPHEPHTQPRQGVDLAADKQVAVNVPMNDVAVFKLYLGNTSQSGETKFYTLEGLQEENPDGAIIRFNGQPTLPYVGVGFGETVEVTMTVARGPVAFSYENLVVEYFSNCEVDRADFLGIDADPDFLEALEFDVYFLEPCSMVETTFPLQDWVLLPSGGNILNVTVAQYDKNDSDLELMRVQYRRSQGDGAWINIAEIPKADLGPVFTNVPWNTQGLQDGLYEIRTVSQCFGAQNPGISKVVKGKIERTPPELFGVPQPADGVLSAGDEISIQFNEPIRCDQIIQADFFNNNNVGLYDTETGSLVDAVISCSGDKIVIVPNVPNKFIENKVLRVEVNNIRDLAGNTFVQKSWEFFVDRNPMLWSGGIVKVGKYPDDEISVTRQLVNTGGQAVAYSLEEVPSWVRVGPANGIIAPGAAETITFTFGNALSFGSYADTIYANTPLGREPMPVFCRVMCESPEWIFDPSGYSGSMNMTARLDVEGALSTDEEDILAAFIDGELRGLAKVQLLPTLPPAGTQYRVFLTIFGEPEDDGKPISLEIWDASGCLRFVDLIETFNFELDNVIGTVGNPTVLHTNSLIRRDVPLSAGWNWISFNLIYPDPSLDVALASLDNPENDLLKGQGAFSEYFGGNWFGSLSEVDNTHLFQFRADQVDTVRMAGAPVDPSAVSIPISAGWNWVGYVPNYPLPVSTALQSLTPLNGDIIKGQTAFAQYVAGFGWLGSLQYMEPPKGYQLKISIPGTLTYPPPVNAAPVLNERGPELPNFWTVDPTQYEYSMTLVGMLAHSGINTTLAGHEIGVFAGNELRGSAKAIYLDQLDMHLFFLTMYANTAGELLHFKLYDAATGQVTNLTETMYFTAGLHQGSVQSPVPFGYQSTTAVTEVTSGQSLQVSPNPFTDGTTIRFTLTYAQRARVLITDMAGRIVLDERMAGSAGTNALLWNAKDAPSGVYFVKLETEEGTSVKKVVRN